MARTTATAVEGILEEAPSLSLTPFIETASLLVTKCCSTKTDADGNDYYDAAHLELIERYLSAHFYHVAATRVTQEKADVVGETKRSAVGLGLNVTHYGQQAMVIDVAGGLAAANEHRAAISAGVVWLGTENYDSTGSSS